MTGEPTVSAAALHIGFPDYSLQHHLEQLPASALAGRLSYAHFLRLLARVGAFFTLSNK